TEVAQEWRARGFSCGLWVDPPGQRWEDYVHDVDELVMVVDGEVEFEIAGHVHRPQPGEELLIPARALHSVRNLGQTTSHWLYGYAAATSLGQFCPLQISSQSPPETSTARGPSLFSREKPERFLPRSSLIPFSRIHVFCARELLASNSPRSLPLAAELA